jgi:hypothetical protein
MFFLPALFAGAQVYIGTEPTGNPVLLEVKSTNQGVLLPRIDIADTLLPSPVDHPHDGLLVVNIHEGKEGLYFWNGKAWEKLKTVETTSDRLKRTGKKVVFIGNSLQSQTGSLFENGVLSKVIFDTSFINSGELTGPKDAYKIPDSGIYEITASFTGDIEQGKGVEAFYALYIYNYRHTNDENKAVLARALGRQKSDFTSISAKATYCGLFKGAKDPKNPNEKDEQEYMGIRLYYKITGTNSNNVPSPKIRVDMSIRKILN